MQHAAQQCRDAAAAVGGIGSALLLLLLRIIWWIRYGDDPTHLQQLLDKAPSVAPRRQAAKGRGEIAHRICLPYVPGVRECVCVCVSLLGREERACVCARGCVGVRQGGVCVCVWCWAWRSVNVEGVATLPHPHPHPIPHPIPVPYLVCVCVCWG